MTLTPRTIRTDLKCGKGAIRQGQKCSKGAATAVEKRPNMAKRTLAIGAGLAIGAAGIAAVARNPGAMNAIRRQARNAIQAPQNAVGHARMAYIRNRQSAAMNPNRVPKNTQQWNPWMDSIWAEGFQP